MSKKIMDIESRQKFWDKLCSLPGVNFDEEEVELRKSIKYPTLLARYRPVNIKNLEALRVNKLYFSSSDYYDDPFDTFINIDMEELIEEYKMNFTDENIDSFFKEFKDVLSPCSSNMLNLSNVTKEIIKTNIDKLILNFTSNLFQLRNELRKDIWSACFSEDLYNENLWMKYADNHKGFALVYDISVLDNILCGKQEKCSACSVVQNGADLYPIVYSDEKFDATAFAKQYIMKKFFEEYPNAKHKEYFDEMKANIWDRYKICLKKKMCHNYDKEWRILFRKDTGSSLMKWIPTHLILGLKMDASEEALVVNLAKQAGINSFFKCIIDINGDLSTVKLEK